LESQGRVTSIALLQCRVLAPVKNSAKITGFKVDQAVLKAQWCIDALSQKKGALRLVRVVFAFNNPFQLSGIGGVGAVSFANEPSSGENLRAVHEPVGDR